jgi:protein TIF31
MSLKFLDKALELNLKFHGIKSLKVAVSYHLVARTQSCMGDFRSALTNEKETFAIYKTQLGDDHDKTKESGECLKHLTQQAVVLQKKMNEIYTGKSKATLPPIQIQPPSMGSVLDMLNIINGILFVQISQQDIENFKMEYEKRQKDTPSGSGDNTKSNKENTFSLENDECNENAHSSSNSNIQSRDSSEENSASEKNMPVYSSEDIVEKDNIDEMISAISDKV